jgi:hypothetical protein
MAAVARWPKMFSLGGTFAAAALRLERQKVEARAAEISMRGEDSRFGSTSTASSAERESYLDTKSLSDGFDKFDGITSVEFSECSEETTEELPKKFKKPNWRTLVRRIGLAKYEKVLEAQVEAQQFYRKTQLRQKYPLATFTDLNGVTWGKPYYDSIEEIEPDIEVAWIEAHKLKLLSDAATEAVKF